MRSAYTDGLMTSRMDARAAGSNTGVDRHQIAFQPPC
jgi:hypothetical protein